jgi:phosphoserine phosphatase
VTRRLCVLDVDSTLITSEVIELLEERAGVRENAATPTEVAAFVTETPNGERDAAETLARRVATLEGVPTHVCDDVLATIRFTPGAENLVETLHARGWAVALVSTGFGEIVGPLAARLGITQFRANALEASGGYLTGQTSGPMMDAAAKEAALIEFAKAEEISLRDTVAIGGSAGDLPMMRASGLGIAFNAKPDVVDQADVAVNSTRLDAVLEFLEP